MVRRIDPSAAAAQLQLTARPTGRKWSPELNCRPIKNCGAANPGRSAQQVGSNQWPRAVGGAEGGALMGVGGPAGAGRLGHLDQPSICIEKLY
eukprot:SAG31_NODE_20_length_34168_cov_33.651296_18_plen_93_part_00